jgi:hypothetical protein
MVAGGLLGKPEVRERVEQIAALHSAETSSPR